MKLKSAVIAAAQVGILAGALAGVGTASAAQQFISIGTGGDSR